MPGLMLALATAWPAAAAADNAVAAAGQAASRADQVQLRWELLRNELPPQGPGRALARLTITDGGKLPLPASGWAVYFNVMDGLSSQDVGNGLLLEQVSGQLFRLRPASGFAGLAPGASITADFHYPSPLTNTVRAPAGPYLAFDDQPESGVAIPDYRIAPLVRPEQLDAGPSAPPLVTPETWYARNANIADIAAEELPPVFPTPQRVEDVPGVLLLSAMPVIHAPPALRNEADAATALLAPYFGAARPAADGPRVTLQLGPVTGSASPEAYVLTADPAHGITVQGATPAGVYRGLQSLRQLLPFSPAPGGVLGLKALRIADAPRFAYRGVMLDVARNFQPKETVFRLLDLMARYKLNTFHFHLTDDEGWRLAIAGLPELTDIGARRGHTLTVSTHLQPAYGSGASVNDPHGSGFYTRADYIEILRYAHARHIEVIPEIEMPGHARAAVKAMAQRYDRLAVRDPAAARRYLLRDAGDKSVYTSPQLYHDHVIDPGLDSSYAFIEQVVAEVAGMHKSAGVPLTRMHVGGDEVPAGAWEKSPASRRVMQRLKMTSTVDLWDHFYDRVTRILARHGIAPFGWQEMAERTVIDGGARRKEPNPLFRGRGMQALVWDDVGNAQDMAGRLAETGYGVVLAPATQLYFDMAYNRNPDEPGVNWAAYTELEKVFAFDPLAYSNKRSASNILGLESTLFTETVRELDRMDYLLMPRMLALAERAWAPAPAWAGAPDAQRAAQLRNRDWSLFVNQLGKRVLPRLDAERSGIAYRIAPPGLHIEQGKVLVNHQLPGFSLHYTVDGSTPGPDSPRAAGPITAQGLFRAAAVASDGRVGTIAEIRLP